MSTFALSRRSFRGPSFLGGLFIVLWSSAWIAGKFGLLSTGPLTLLVIRFGGAALMLLVLALVTGASWPRRLADYGHLAVAGLLVQAGALGGTYIGLTHGVSAGTSALLVGTTPLFTALAAAPLLDEKIETAQWSGMLIGLIGVTLVVVNKISVTSGGWEGYAVTIAAVAAFVLGTLYQKKFLSHIDLSTGNFIQFLVATAAVLPLAFRFEGMHAQWNGGLIASALWLSLVNSVGAVSLLYSLLRQGSATQVSTLFFLVPPVTAVMGFAAFHETLSVVAVIGFALAAGGVYLGSRRRTS